MNHAGWYGEAQLSIRETLPLVGGERWCVSKADAANL
jgi:hypothetical protein